MRDERQPVQVEYQSPGIERRPRMYQLRAWHVIALVVVPAVIFVWMSGNVRRRNADNECARNLHQVGLAVHEYADTNGGRFPDAVADVLNLHDVGADTLVCDQTGDSEATGATTQAVQASVAAGGHLSFVYVGRGLTTATANGITVVAYERLGCRPGGGTNVLFGDSSVRLVPASQIPALLSALAPAGSTRPTTFRRTS